MATPTRHPDAANKRLFSHSRMAADLLRLLDEPWVGDLRLDRLRRLPAEHVAEDLRRRLADLPWWAPFRPGGGRPAGVLLHVEFQSQPERHMAERLWEYAALLRRDLLRSGWLSAERLALDAALVVYDGDARWNAPRQVGAPAASAEPLPPRLAPLQPRFGYRLLDAKDYAGDDAADGNLARAALALDAAPADGVAAALRRAAALIAAAGDQELRRSFQAWFRGMRPELADRLDLTDDMKEDAMPMLARTLARWEQRNLETGRQEGRRMGRQEGRRLGRQEGRRLGLREGRQEGLEAERSLLGSQARRRFGAATGTALAAVLAGIDDSAELARIGALIIDCDSGAELLARARPRLAR